MVVVPSMISKLPADAEILRILELSEDEEILFVPENVIFPVASTTDFTLLAVTELFLTVPEPDKAVKEVSSVGNFRFSWLISPPLIVMFEDDANVTVGVVCVLQISISEKYFGPTSFLDPKAVVARPEMSPSIKIMDLPESMAA